MRYKKTEYYINFDGTCTKKDLGTIDSTRIDSDQAWERDRKARIARSSGRVQSIEVLPFGIVTTYATGNVMVVGLVYSKEETEEDFNYRFGKN
ncbi:hypothetical protein SEA_ATUIN_270 [Arthrobacter phage Atuin]|nr:hypothetical protein SEA_ATUIN_69 [Arthrobacter phage Atuin]